MVENTGQYKKFLEEISNHEVIIQLINCDYNVPSSITSPSLVFIKDIYTKKTYYISFQHPDCKSFITWQDFSKDFNSHPIKIGWAINKKEIYQSVGIKNVCDIDLFLYLQDAKTIDYLNYQTSAHQFIYRTHPFQKKLNNAIPLLKHKEMFESLCEDLLDLNILNIVSLDDGFLKENSIILETLSDLEMNGIFINKECFKLHFPNARIFPNNMVYSQYNLYTSTGRPSNRYDGVNYAALNKEDGSRGCFISRYGNNGKMILIDYSAFHPRIICNLINFDIPIDTDIYQYLGELYFGRKVVEYDINEIKSITMKQFYGSVEPQYQHIKFFSHTKDFIEKNWNFFQKNGYILTPIFKRKITSKHCVDANSSKLFNYILQATETEIGVQVLKLINQYLKNKKTKAVLYTYDSILFDFNADDGIDTLRKIIEIMKLKNRFPVKIYAGNSYHSIEQIYL